MTEPVVRQGGELAPVQAGHEQPETIWTWRLLWFLLGAMAVLSMLKGLRYWAAICGFGLAPEGGFEGQTMAWQAATIFFAVIDLVAAVGLVAVRVVGRGGLADRSGVIDRGRGVLPGDLRRPLHRAGGH